MTNNTPKYFSSLSCTLLNLFLIYCLLTIDEFKSLLFFPIGLQAGTVALEPGNSNIVYSLVSHFQVREILIDYEAEIMENKNLDLNALEHTVLLIGMFVDFQRKKWNRKTQ